MNICILISLRETAGVHIVILKYVLIVSIGPVRRRKHRWERSLCNGSWYG
jgi:hypothetical protein